MAAEMSKQQYPSGSVSSESGLQEEAKSTGVNLSVQLDRDYGEGIQDLGYIFLGSGYSSSGVEARNDAEKVENLICQLKEFGANDIARVCASLNRYVEGSLQSSTPARYAIGHDNQTLNEFLTSSKALIDLISGNSVAAADFDSTLTTLAKNWFDLGAKLFELDKNAQQRGIDLDYAELSREKAQPDLDLRDSEIPRKVDDSPTEEDREFGAPDDGSIDQEEELLEEEGVANWPGRTGGNWT